MSIAVSENKFSMLYESDFEDQDGVGDEDQDSDEDQDGDMNTDIDRNKEYKIIVPIKTGISLEFVNSKPIRIKRYNKYNNHKKTLIKDNKKTLIKDNKKIGIYNEIENLPKNITDAIKKKQNLTLKQILILMSLHAIPGMVLNMIHDNLQTQVRRKYLRIFHDSRIFYVSQYNWYDLKKIENMINTMLE